MATDRFLRIGAALALFVLISLVLVVWARDGNPPSGLVLLLVALTIGLTWFFERTDGAAKS